MEKYPKFIGVFCFPQLKTTKEQCLQCFYFKTRLRSKVISLVVFQNCPFLTNKKGATWIIYLDQGLTFWTHSLGHMSYDIALSKMSGRQLWVQLKPILVIGFALDQAPCQSFSQWSRTHKISYYFEIISLWYYVCESFFTFYSNIFQD